jgi:hypothetical protein
VRRWRDGVIADAGGGHAKATSTVVLVASEVPRVGQMSQRLRCTNGSLAHCLPRPQVLPA